MFIIHGFLSTNGNLSICAHFHTITIARQICVLIDKITLIILHTNLNPLVFEYRFKSAKTFFKKPNIEKDQKEPSTHLNRFGTAKTEFV